MVFLELRRVETSLGENDVVGNINVSNSTLSTTITADTTNYMIGYKSASKDKFHARTAGLIAFIGNSYQNVSGISGSYTAYPIKEVADPSYVYKTYAKISLDDIMITDGSIDLTAANNEYVNMSGGLLGYAWCNVETTMNNITVTGCEINSLGSVGGLVTFIAGKFDVDSVTLNSLKMNCVDTGYEKARSYSSLLFSNGEFAYVTLNQDNYIVKTSSEGEERAVKISGYSQYFDEIVGINVQRKFGSTKNADFFEQDINEAYKTGGILNIINSKFSSFDTNSGYESYTNKVCTTSNKYTRYYYNLFQGEGWKFEEVLNSVKITSPQQLMTWHVGVYADRYLKSFFVEYFSGKSDYWNKYLYVDLSGNLDMRGYSLYPTSIDGVVFKGADDTTITLYGEEISELEHGLFTDNRSKIYRNNELKGIYSDAQSEEECTQHYLSKLQPQGRSEGNGRLSREGPTASSCTV